VSSAIPDPVIPLIAAAKFVSLTPLALQSLKIGVDEQQQTYKLSGLMEVLKERTTQQQQAARWRSEERRLRALSGH
jgi:hypothetical protein